MEIMIDLGSGDLDSAAVATMLVALARSLNGIAVVPEEPLMDFSFTQALIVDQSGDQGRTLAGMRFATSKPTPEFFSFLAHVRTRVRAIQEKADFKNAIGASEAGMMAVALEGYYPRDDDDCERRRLMLEVFESIMFNGNALEDLGEEPLYYSLVPDAGAQPNVSVVNV